jgi:hypothetical protein
MIFNRTLSKISNNDSKALSKKISDIKLKTHLKYYLFGGLLTSSLYTYKTVITHGIKSSNYIYDGFGRPSLSMYIKCMAKEIPERLQDMLFVGIMWVSFLPLLIIMPVDHKLDRYKKFKERQKTGDTTDDEKLYLKKIIDGKKLILLREKKYYCCDY